MCFLVIFWHEILSIYQKNSMFFNAKLLIKYTILIGNNYETNKKANYLSNYY